MPSLTVLCTLQAIADLPLFNVSAGISGQGYTAGTDLNYTLVVIKNGTGPVYTSNSSSVTVAEGAIPPGTGIGSTGFAACDLTDGDYVAVLELVGAPNDVCGDSFNATDFPLVRSVKSFTVTK